MTVYSAREIFDFARAAGFDPEEAATWTAIALAESGGRTNALNNRGEHSMGLWQINVGPKVRPNIWGNLNDPEVNARAAYDISGHGSNMRPWTTTHDSNKGTARDYRHYLAEVESVTGVHGDWSGVAGYDTEPRDPTSTPGSDEIDAGAPLDAVDSDHDGLTDEFERFAGLKVHSKDSDHDGLSDAFEAMRSYTDPLSADTDHDDKSDALEYATGTDAGRLPGVAGVVGTGRFAHLERDGVRDRDHDGLSNFYERQTGTDPKSADSDHDQLSDSLEVSLGTDAKSLDTDDDGLADGTEAQFGSDPLHPDTGDGTAPAAPSAGPADDASTTVASKLGTSQQLSFPTQTTSPAAEATHPGVDGGNLDDFLRAALRQAGDPYVWGAYANPNDRNPDAFDCSELTKWAAHRAGVDIPDTATAQYLDLKHKNALIPVDQAIHTPGALLFYFSKMPQDGDGRPAQAHVAISLGDGKTIEAKGTQYGVDEFKAVGRFNAAGVIPGISDKRPPEGWSLADVMSSLGSSDEIDAGAPLDAVDSDHDGLTDEFERFAGLKVHSKDSDHDGLSDAFEAMRSYTDPLSADTDHDKKSDALEYATGTDAGRLPGVAGVVGTGRFAHLERDGVRDRDHDGLSNFYERQTGTDPKSADTDQDQLSDSLEVSLGTDAKSLDTDDDGLADGTEVRFGSDPLNPDAGDGTPPPTPLTDPTDELS